MSPAHRGDWAYRGDGSRIFVPDVKIVEDRDEYAYEPLRGYSASLAVVDDGRCIGWIDTRTLGYEDAKSWMADVGHGGPHSAGRRSARHPRKRR